MRAPTFVPAWSLKCRQGLLVLLGSVGLLWGGHAAFGQSQTLLYWNSSGTGIPLGGSGTWNTSLTDWTPNNGATYQTWANSGAKTAVFGGMSGTITVSATNTVGSMIFNSDGYVLTGTTLSMVNDPLLGMPTIVLSNAGQTTTINNSLAGSKGLAVEGPGTLILGGKSTFTNGTNGLNILGGATLRLMAVSGSIPSGAQLFFGRAALGGGAGGTFILDNTGATGSLSRTMAQLGGTNGDGTVETDRVAAQNLSLTFTTFSFRNIGATINFVTNGGTNGTQNKIVLSSLGAGAIDAGVFFSGSSYAWYDDGGFVRGINYGTDAGTLSVGGATSVASVAELQTTGAVTSQTSAVFTSIKISGSNDFTIASGNQVQVDGLLKAGGGTSVVSGGTISASGSEMVVRSNAADDVLTINSAITDSLGGTSTSLTKSGLGALVLAGVNTFTGPLTINGGVVSVASLPVSTEASPLGTAAVQFASGTLRYTGTASTITARGMIVETGGGAVEASQPGATLTLSGQITGNDQNMPSDSLVLRGNIVLSGTDDNSALYVTVDSGTTLLAKDSAFFTHAASRLYVNSGGTAILGGTGGDQIYDFGTANVNTGGVLDFNGQSEIIDGLNGNGTVTNNSLTTSSTLTIGTDSVANSKANGIFTGVIQNGAGGQTMALVKSGTGTQVLAGNNTYTGGTTMTGGTLQIGNSGTTGSVLGDIDTGLAGGTSTTLAFNRSDAYNYFGTILGAGTVNMIGTGTLTLTGVNTYSGTTNIKAGTLKLGSAGSGVNGPLGSIAAGTFVSSGATLDLDGFSLATAEALSLIGSGVGGTGALINSSTSAVTYSGTVTLGSGGAAIGGIGDISLSSKLVGNVLLTKAGSNTLTLTTDSARTGGATVTGGTLRLLTATALGTAGTITLNGGNLALANNSSTTFGAYNTTVSSDATITADHTTSDSTSVTHTLGTLSMGAHTLTISRGSLITGGGTGGIAFGAVTLSASGGTFAPSAGAMLTLASVTGAGRSFSVAGAGDTVISGAITTGAGALSKSGPGSLTLSGSGSYTGGTSISGGTLTANNNNALGTGAVTVTGGAFLLVPADVAISNTVTLGGGSYNRQIGAGASLANAINAASSFASGPPDTAAQILDGTSSAAATLQSSFSSASSASNDTVRQSDVYSFAGTGTDVFVLQLSINSTAPGSYLAYLDENDEWVNAVLGNNGGTPVFVSGAYDPSLDFHLGFYGLDPATGSAWAVLNHNSDYAIVVPEPGTWALIGLGGMVLMFFRRRWR